MREHEMGKGVTKAQSSEMEPQPMCAGCYTMYVTCRDHDGDAWKVRRCELMQPQTELAPRRLYCQLLVFSQVLRPSIAR